MMAIFIYRISCLIIFLFITSFNGVLSAEAAEIYAVHYPPLMIQNSPEHPGFAIEIIQEADRRAGEQSSIKFYPFARMTKTLLTRQMAIFPTLYRTPQREKKFLWIAKVFKVENAFHTVGEPVNSLEEAGKLHKIGVVARTALHGFLQAQGMDNLVIVTRPELNAHKLAAGRIDAWFLTTFLARMIWRQEAPQLPLVSGKPIVSPDAFIAANINFPPALAAKYRSIITKMHKDGTIRKIVARYGLEINSDMVIIYP